MAEPSEPFDIQRIIQELRKRNMQITGPMNSGERVLYTVNGHTFAANELRELWSKNLLSSWDIFNYARVRSARRAS